MNTSPGQVCISPQLLLRLWLVHELCPGSQVPVSPTLYEFVVSPCWVFDLVSLTSVGMWVLPPQARPQVVTAEHWKTWRVAIG